MSNYLGIDIGGTKIAIGLISHDKETDKLNIKKYAKRPTGSTFTYQIAEQFLTEFIKELETENLQFEAVGIAIPGLLDDNGKVLLTIDIPQLQEWEPHKFPLFAGKLVVSYNDAKAAQMQTCYNSQPNDTIITFVIGTGIGSSYLIEGKILKGKSGWAGEVGASPFINGGEGRFDFKVGGKFLLEEMKCTPEEFDKLLKDNDAKAKDKVNEFGTNFGKLIATVINIFNPHKVVVGGGTLLWPGYMEAALEAAKKYSVPPLYDDCIIEKSEYGQFLVLIGAVRGAVIHGKNNRT